MHQTTTVFTELKFYALILFSLFVPLAVYAALFVKRTISQAGVLVLGIALIAIAGIDVYLLRSLETMAQATSSLSDDAFFVSELSLALYLLPALFGGTGINLISHVLIRHLTAAERRHDDQQRLLADQPSRSAGSLERVSDRILRSRETRPSSPA